MPYENPHLRFSAATETMKKNLITNVLTYAGGVTFRRSFREAGKEVNRPVDLEGVGKIEEAIATGWLLHFPTGTTQKHAPIRPGMAQLLHRTKPIAVPMRVDGFQELLLHKQFPGRTGKKATIRFFPPMDLDEFYAAPFDKERGTEGHRGPREAHPGSGVGAPALGAGPVRLDSSSTATPSPPASPSATAPRDRCRPRGGRASPGCCRGSSAGTRSGGS